MGNLHFLQLLKHDCFNFCRIPLESIHLSFSNEETKIMSMHILSQNT